MKLRYILFFVTLPVLVAIASIAAMLAFIVGLAASANASCSMASLGSNSGEVQIEGQPLDGEQAKHAALIASIGTIRHIPDQGRAIAVAVAIGESRLRNLAHGDRDSLGLYQQRPSQGWGTPEQIMDPEYAINKFYDALVAVNGWETMPPMEAAIAVQRPSRAAYERDFPKFYEVAQAILGFVVSSPGGCSAGGGPVYILGDSLLQGMLQAHLETRLQEAGWSVTSNALQGRSISGGPSPDGLAQLEQDAQGEDSPVKKAGTIVVVLGTNHLGGDFEAEVDKLYRKIKGLNANATIYWVNTVGEGPTAEPLRRNSEILDRFKETHNNVQIINWASVGTQYINDPATHVHLSDYTPMVDFVADALGKPAFVALGDGVLAWPEPAGSTLTSCFGMRDGDLHAGVDISKGAGTQVLAAANGKVTKAGPIGGYGPNFVALYHEDLGIGTSYGHMSVMYVQEGQEVERGQPIGLEGNEGRSRGSHLHFNVFRGPYTGSDSANLDPLQNGLSIPEGVRNQCR